MKIDPVFPSAPVVTPPKYKFRPGTTSMPDADRHFSDEVVVKSSEDAWPSDVKVLLLFASVLTLGVLFS